MLRNACRAGRRGLSRVLPTITPSATAMISGETNIGDVPDQLSSQRQQGSQQQSRTEFGEG